MRGSGSQARLIEDFLKREYGVKGLKIEHRTKHAKLHWTHQGSAYAYLCSRNTTGDGHAALQNAKSNIRRMMRAPTQIESLEGEMKEAMMEDVRERVIADLMQPDPIIEKLAPPVEPDPAKVWPVMVSGYTNARCSPQVHFFFPAGIGEVLPAFAIEQLDEEHWKFRKGARHWRSVPWAVRATVRTSVATDAITSFRAMPVDAIEADGEVLVYVPMADRVAPQIKRRPPSKYAVKPPLKEEPMPEPTIPEQRDAIEKQLFAASPPPEAEPIEFRMREILRQIREIEQITPYTLKISEAGKVIWHAPVIE